MSSYRPSDFFENVEPLFRRGRGGRPPNFPQWTPGRGSRRLLWLVAIVIVLLVVSGPVVSLYTDWLWFRELGFAQLFTTRLAYQLALFGAGFVLAALFTFVNVLLALRLGGPSLSALGIRRRWLGTAPGRVAILGAVGFGLLMGLVAAGGWETVAKALNATAFGKSDPIFNQDIGYYLFRLPAYRFAWGWLLGLVVVTGLACAGIYSARAGTVGQLVLPRVGLGHLALFVSAFFFLLAIHYRLAMYSVLTSQNGFVNGAGYTDVHVRIPVYWVLLVLTFIMALAILATVWRPQPLLLIGAPALWLLVLLFGLGLVPALVQATAVRPAELSQERPYIQHQIDFTNQAYALDRISSVDFPDQAKLSAQLLDANAGTVKNIRLWDYQPLRDAYQALQTIRQFYDFNDVDIDRYQLQSGYRQVMISARELSQDKLPANAQTWVNTHLKYTHGYGAAATPVTGATSEGQPSIILGDIPPAGELSLKRPQIYFGEKTGDYVITGATENEIDFQKQDTQQDSRWEGTHGVPVGGFFRRLAFSLRFGDLNLFLSSEVKSQSQLLFHRNIVDRLQTLAPFLTLDRDPYIVVANGRLYWVVDAYTTATEYPYSEPNDPNTGVNYERNSVKAVIDAYEGTVNFYVADAHDPVIKTYARIFGGAFQPLSEMPDFLRSHIRYPEDFFTLQERVFQTYHMHNPESFYNKSDQWAEATEIPQPGGSPVTLQPYYIVMQLPGQSQPEFVLIQPYTPLNKNNMVAWMAARSDGDSYGTLLNYRFPTGRTVNGPGQIEGLINNDPAIAQQFKLLGGAEAGSQVIRGNLLVIPVGDSILFVEPIFIQASTGVQIPELKFVAVASQEGVALGTSLDDALGKLTGGQITTTTSNQPPPTTTTTQAQLLAKIQALFADAHAKLAAGDLGGYQADINQVESLVQQLAGGASPSPSPSASPAR